MRASALALAFSGFRGAGKTTLSRMASDHFQWPRVSFGEEVRRMARERGMPDDLATLLSIGTEEVDLRPMEFCSRVLGQARDWTPGGSIVVDGLRHLRMREVLGKLIAPTSLINIFVDPPDELRKQRLVDRIDPFSELFTGHKNEVDILELKRTADLVVKHSDSISEIAAFIRRDTRTSFDQT